MEHLQEQDSINIEINKIYRCKILINKENYHATCEKKKNIQKIMYK